MMLTTYLEISAGNLVQHRRRNALLGAALVLVTALLVVLHALAASISTTVLESALTLMSGHVNVGGFFKVTRGMATPFLTDYARVLAAVKKDVPELDYATVRGRGFARVTSAAGSLDLMVVGVDIASEAGLRARLQVLAGKLDDLARPNAVLLFADQAQMLGVQVGDDLTLVSPSTRGANNTADVRIAAIAKNLGLISTRTAFIANDTLLRLYQIKPGTSGVIQLHLRDADAVDEVAERLRTTLAAAGWRVMEPDSRPTVTKLLERVHLEDWVGQKLDVSTWKDEMSFIGWMQAAVNALTGLLMAILVAIVVIGVTDAMWIMLRERTRELGTMRAIGMRRRGLLRLCLLEAVMLGGVSAALGGGLGALVALLVNHAAFEVPAAAQVFIMSHALTLRLTAANFAVDVAIMIGATTLGALYPAWRASRLPPITAVHHVG